MISPRLLLPLAAGLALLVPPIRAASHRHPDAKDAYTITSVIELVKPFNLDDMNDDFQDARILSQNAKSGLVEITYYPLFNPEIGENPNWRKDYAGMTEYLKPTPAENWDEQMQRDLLAELREAGIDPDQLTDRKLVEQVSRWAMKRSKSTKAFAIWTFHYPEGKPVVLPDLRHAFEAERAKANKTEQQMIDEEVLGRSMFYNKVHGSCTSSSIYLTTIFRALGIPTRTVFCIPPFDCKDPKQAELFYESVQHHRVRETVREAIGGMKAFANHLFNEVYVGGRWVRLNYSTLGQPILDAHFFGLLTHIYTASDLSQVPLAETWGKRFFSYPAGQAKLSSSNPYRLISISDQFGENARIENAPVAPPPELTTATIAALLLPDSPDLPKFVQETMKSSQHRPDFILSFKEWVKGTYMQMRVFQPKVGNDFVLSAPGHPDLRARLTGQTFSVGDGSFQGYCVSVTASDRGKIAPGAAYTIKPVNISETYRWQVPPTLKPIVLQPGTPSSL